MDKDEKYKRKTHAGFFYSGGVGVLGGSGSGTSDSALRPAIADCSGSGADFREFRALRTCTRDDGGGTSRNCDCLCVVTGAWNFDGFVSGDSGQSLSDPSCDTDGSDDCDGADSDHLYGIWNGTEDFDGCADVLFPGCCQLCGWSGAGE